MFCPKCRAENSDTSRFCSSCAAPLIPTSDGGPVHTETIVQPAEKLTRGTLFAGRYEIIEELGRGGMGRVYRAEDIKAKEDIALKLIKPEFAADRKTVERFRSELTTARKIRHKNICGMYDLGEDRGTVFITMEYIPGEDLKSFIRRSKSLSIPNACFVARQICEGLEEAHSRGVIHRDLKPSNVMIDREGNARIMDFGIARTLKAGDQTGEGLVVGTPEYMSPEQAEARDVDHRTDIYSLGVILYEMVTGRPPFSGETPLGVAMKHKSEAPADPRAFNPQIPDDLRELILKCLEKDRNKRYQNAAELGSTLEAIEKGVAPTSAEAPARAARTTREITVTIGLKKLLIPGLAVAGAAVIAVVLLLLLPKKSTPPAESFKASLAVLPFEDLSPAKDQAFLCDGISESLINALTKIQDLRIPARTSSFSFKGEDRNLREIGQRLNVERVLEGSVQRAGDELRVTVKLVNVSDESVQWSEQYNKRMADVFSIQDEITLNVVEALKVKLSGGEKERLTHRETTDPEAYQLYLQGQHFRWIENRENFLKAKDYFEQAIGKDPGYASAYAGLADIYMLLGLFSMMSRDEADRQAHEAARKALELDENSAEGHTALAVIHTIYDWDWQGAEREFKRAIVLNPNYFAARYEYGYFLSRINKLNEAESELKKALQIDPLSYRGHDAIRSLYRLKGDKEKAEAHRKLYLELNPQIVSGKTGVERVQMEIETEGRLPQLLSQLAKAYIRSGQEAEARNVLDEMKRSYEHSDRGDIAFNTSLVYISFGEKDKAFEWLERSYEKRDPYLMTINTNLNLDPIRQDPRFKALLKKMGLE